MGLASARKLRVAPLSCLRQPSAQRRLHHARTHAPFPHACQGGGRADMAVGLGEQDEAAGGEAAPASAGAPAACAPGSPLPWEGLAEEALRGALASAHAALSQLEHVDAPGLMMTAAAAAAAARPAKRGRVAGGGGAAAADMALLRCARCHAGAALWERAPRQEASLGVRGGARCGRAG
jgi:hypothetical protein